MPFGGNDSDTSFTIAGQPPIAAGNHPDASDLTIAPGYFRTMKVPLRSGRDFDARDSEKATKVAMVNETFVRRYLPNMNPIGQHILLDRPDGAAPLPLEIIGVVRDTKQNELGTPSLPEFYRPFMQNPERRLWLVVRSATEGVGGMQAAIARAIHEIDPEVFVGEVTPMQNLLGEQLARPRFNMMLLGVFAAVAMALAAIGIYGVIAYSVAQRTREIGIRMALGAQRADMLTMILRQSLTVVGIGIAVGLLAAFGGTRLLASLLYGVGANDVLIYAAVVFLLGAAALLASYIPARRAMKVDPIIALRYE
jgi:putative ABC transport system permease protein